MAIQNFFTSRDNKLDGNTYVGQLGRLWYNPDTNSIYASDGSTVGGIPIDLATGANIVANNITVNRVTSTSGTVSVTGNLAISGNISPAAVGKIGGITPGPGANVSNTGLLTINTAGLTFSFGDFTANAGLLTLVNNDENMTLQTLGNAEIQLVGNIGFYRPDGLPPNVANRFFYAQSDGQITIYVPDTDPLEGAVEIVGSSTGNTIAPGIAGAMLHTTGQLGQVNRTYLDGNGDYVSIVGRRWNGNVAVPTQVLANQDILRINATAATDVGVGNVALAQIAFTALENQTATAQGSEITFTVTPVGSAATSRVEVANVTVANGVTATKFTTAGTVSATGNITGGNVLTGGLISATGAIASGDGISDSKGDVRSIPVNTQNTGYTLVATDAGKLINMTTGNVTVPAGVFTTPFGQAITIYNDQNSSNAIVQGSGVTIRLAGTAATGNRTLARYGLATLVCVSANTFVISGAGLT